MKYCKFYLSGATCYFYFVTLQVCRDQASSWLLQVDGTLMNTGHDVKLLLDDASSSASATYVNVSGGPLAYQYRVHELSIHFGRDDTRGSEHSIKNQHFPAEVSTLSHSLWLSALFTINLRLLSENLIRRPSCGGNIIDECEIYRIFSKIYS